MFSVKDLMSLLKTTDFQFYREASEIHSELRRVNNVTNDYFQFAYYNFSLLFRSSTRYQQIPRAKVIFFQQTHLPRLFHPLPPQKCLLPPLCKMLQDPSCLLTLVTTCSSCWTICARTTATSWPSPASWSVSYSSSVSSASSCCAKGRAIME